MGVKSDLVHLQTPPVPIAGPRAGFSPTPGVSVDYLKYFLSSAVTRSGEAIGAK